MIQIDYERIRNLCLFLLAAVILFFCAIGCKTIAPVASSDTVRQTIIKEVIKDSTIYITDSAGFRAALICDSLGNVRIKQIQDYYAGQFVKPTIVIKDNFVSVACKIDSAAIYFKWKERHETTSEVINTVKVDRVNYLTGFQWAQVWLGRLLLLMVILYIGVRLLKRYTSLKLPI